MGNYAIHHEYIYRNLHKTVLNILDIHNDQILVLLGYDSLLWVYFQKVVDSQNNK